MIMEYHPSASKKYLNTRSLLMKSTELRGGIEESDLKKPEKAKIYSAVKLLKLKEQVLMYLEDMTNGRIHQGVEPDELQRLCDWVTQGEPLHPLPKKLSTHSYSSLSYLRTYIEQSKNPQHAREEVSKLLYLESRPEIDLDKVENIVMAGGGAKAFSLTGTVKSLEKNNRSEQIKRVAGTSGGAIIAMAYAAGYDSGELQNLVNDNEFGLFTLESRLTSSGIDAVSHWFFRDKPDHLAHSLSDNKLANIFHEELIRELPDMILRSKSPRLAALQKHLGKASWSSDKVKRLVSALRNHKDGDSYFEGVLGEFSADEILDMEGRARASTASRTNDLLTMNSKSLYSKPKKAFVSAARHQAGRDIILGFFHDVIVDKLQHLPKESLQKAFGKEVVTRNDLRAINFEQWQALHEMHPGKIKELHISICWKENFKTYHANASHKNEEFSKLSVAEAVRVSMNLPLIFPKYEFEVEGRKYKGIDGGVVSNVSFEAFDNDHPIESTIGVFYSTKSRLKKSTDLGSILTPPDDENDLVRALNEQERVAALSTEVLNRHLDEYKQLTPEEKNGRKGEIYDETISRRTRIMRTAYGRAASLRSDLERLRNKPEVGVIESIKYHIFNSKNQNDLSKSHNRRRLVMVNTQEVDTYDFKLTDEKKNEQMALGEIATDTLLHGSYCLENHFYHNQFEVLSSELSEINPELSDDEIPRMSRIMQEYQPHKYGLSKGLSLAHYEPSEGPQNLGDCTYREDEPSLVKGEDLKEVEESLHSSPSRK